MFFVQFAHVGFGVLLGSLCLAVLGLAFGVMLLRSFFTYREAL